MVRVIRILEMMFSLVVVAGFLFWIWARIVKRTFIEHYNECMDWLLGYKDEAIAIPEAVNKFRSKVIR